MKIFDNIEELFESIKYYFDNNKYSIEKNDLLLIIFKIKITKLKIISIKI